MERISTSVWRIVLALSLTLPAGSTAAEALVAEAGRRLEEGTANSLSAAIDRYRQAIEASREAGDFAAAAETGLALGEAYLQRGEMQHASAAFEQALTAARGCGETRLEIHSLFSISKVLSAIGEGRRAIAPLEQARGLLRRHPEPELEAHVLFYVAVAHERLGEYQEALESYHEALPLLRTAGNVVGEAATLNNLGTVTYELGDFEQSRRFYRQVIAVRRQQGDAAGEARAWTRVGEVDQARGELKQAREHFQRALTLARQAGDRRAEANALNFLSQAYLDLAAGGESQPHARAPLAARTEFGHGLPEDPGSVRGLLEQALALSRELPAPRIEAFSLELLGRLHALLGEPGTAIERYVQAAEASHAIGHSRGEVEALAASAGLRRRLGELDAALADTVAALEILESLRGRTTRQELRTSLFSSQRALHELHVELLMAKHRRDPAAGHDARALAMVERSRGRSLLDQLAESTVDLRQGVDPELLELERALGAQLDAKAAQRLWSDAAESDGAAGRDALLNAQMDALVAELRRVRGRIRHHSPGYAALAAPEPLDAAAIREQLDPETLLLVYQLGDERSFLWAMTREGLRSHELPPRAVIEEAARAAYELLTARNRWPDDETPAERQQRIAEADAGFAAAARELGALVLWPVADRLGRRRAGERLAVIGDGLLHIVPFAALSLAGGEPLITRHEIVHLPSASVLTALRRSGRPQAAKSLLVLADPVLQRDARIGGAGHERTRGFRPPSPANPSRLPRLHFSRREAEMLAALLAPGEATVLLDFAASRAGLTGSGIERYRMLHFATHAMIDDQRPELTGLALSRFDEQGRPRAAFLRLHEIRRLRLAAELVTLSACETALGKPVDGEGLIGMVRGFLHAGAERVVASLWSVQDRATAELMARFYRAMLADDQRPAAALRQAQITLRGDSRFAAPYFWAPFVLQGEWR